MWWETQSPSPNACVGSSETLGSVELPHANLVSFRADNQVRFLQHRLRCAGLDWRLIEASAVDYAIP